MATKITYVSENPAFVSFEAWLANKLNSVSAEEANSIRQIVANKAAANPDVDTNTVNKGSSIEVYTNTTSIGVPGFDEIFHEWTSAYDVQILIEEA
jgi:hypothetical protein